MINLASFVNKFLRLFGYKVITYWLYVKYYILGTKPVVNYLQLLDPVLFTNTYTYAFWKCNGIYRIEISDGASREFKKGNSSKLLIPILKANHQIEFKFYGINNTIFRTLSISADTVSFNTPTINSFFFSQPAFLYTRLSYLKTSEGLTSLLAVNKLVNDIKITTPKARVENIEAKIALSDFRVQLPDFNTHINH